jgi:conjugal transfer ATP-binding protein TraC
MGLNNELIGDFFNSSYRIPSPFFIHYGIYFPDEEKIKSRLATKKAALSSHMRLGTFVKMFPNKVKENEENMYLEGQLREGEKIIQTRLSVGLWGSESQFVKSESTLLSLYQKYGFKLKENKFVHLHDFLFSLPMAWGDAGNYMSSYKKRMLLRTTVTSEIASFVPIVGEWWGNSGEGMILSGRRGQLASWDPFKVGGNLNAVVIGPSGSGKSVFMQDLIMSELGKGTRVFVLDLGRSFEKLCQLIDGQYLFFNQDSKLDLNPFNLLPKGSDFESVGILLDMVTSIIATMAMPSEKIDKERANILSTAVRHVWSQKGSEATIDDIIHFIEKQVFNSELMKGAMESLKEGLKKYTREGVYKNYFYGQNKVNFKSDLVVIETEELKNMPDLQAVILQIFVLNISHQVFMGDREKRFLICIDEAWDLLKSPQMEGFIESMARRLRKYNGALVVGTQSLKDFERSHGARAAYHNSNWLVMLGKDTDSINALKKDGSVHLTDYTEEALNSLRKEDGKYSEAFIFHKQEGLKALLQLRLDPFSAMLYSTKADEFQAIQELKVLGVSVEEAVNWLISNKTKFDDAIRKGREVREIVLAICHEKGLVSNPNALSRSLLKKLDQVDLSDRSTQEEKTQ